MAEVTIRDLRKAYGGVEVIHGVSLDIPDGQFVVGPTDSSGRVVVAGGCSGHSFKHAAALGELAAQLAVGEEPFADIGFLDPRRFAAVG